jgi:hypothetical protein
VKRVLVNFEMILVMLYNNETVYSHLADLKTTDIGKGFLCRAKNASQDL